MTGTYQELLAKKVQTLREQGHSFRELSACCSFSSPNYLQQIIKGKRKLTIPTARQVAKGLGMTGNQSKAFLAMVRSQQTYLAPTDESLAQLARATTLLEAKSVRDIGIHQTWLNAVLFELSRVPKEGLTAKAAAEFLKGQAAPSEISSCLNFMVTKGWLKKVAGASEPTYLPGEWTFEPLDDVRRIEIQRNHLRFLDMAKHRINDDINAREFRGLTVAIPIAKFPEIREKIRRCFEEISDYADALGKPDSVIRIQLAAFKICGSRSSDSSSADYSSDN